MASFFWTSSIAVFLFISIGRKQQGIESISTETVSEDDDENSYSSTDSFQHTDKLVNDEAKRPSSHTSAKQIQPTWEPSSSCDLLNGSRLFPYHVVSWGLAAVVLAISLGFEALGSNAYSRAVGWCWISESAEQITWGLFAGKGKCYTSF